MKQAAERVAFHQTIWNFLASVRLTVTVLLSLAATSVIGTLIPQNAEADWYFHQYGETFFRLFSRLQLFDMYHAWWYQALIVLLVVNIIVCSIDRFSSVWKIVFVESPKFNIEQFRRQKEAQTYNVSASLEILQERYERYIGRRFRYHRVETMEKAVCILAERGRWTRFGVYGVHLSVVLMLIGALIGLVGGFDGTVNIPEGETVNAVRLTSGNKVQPLEFSVRCEDFDVSFYENGVPKEYRSRLSIIENNQTVLQKDIIVNDPLRYKGINIFQSSYGKVPPKEMTVRLTSVSSGEETEVAARMGEPIQLPNQQGALVIQEFKSAYMYKGHRLGETFIGVWTPPSGEPVEVIMPYPFPEYDIHDPEELRRMSAFQASGRRSAGISAPDDPQRKIGLEFASRSSGMTYSRSVSPGERVEIPEGQGTFVITGIEESYAFMGNPIGQAVLGRIERDSREPETVVLPVRFPNFDKMRKGDMVISIVEPQETSAETNMVLSVTAYSETYYTGLQVTKDPGVAMVYLGFIFMILGSYVTFFTSHQRVCIELTPAGKNTRVLVSGTANKNKLGMQRLVENLSRRLRRLDEAGG
ncbi:MAG: cytochrome c biogenesis protein ResB [Thermodesulfobacteriota bacterium]